MKLQLRVQGWCHTGVLGLLSEAFLLLARSPEGRGCLLELSHQDRATVETKAACTTFHLHYIFRIRKVYKKSDAVLLLDS